MFLHRNKPVILGDYLPQNIFERFWRSTSLCWQHSFLHVNRIANVGQKVYRRRRLFFRCHMPDFLVRMQDESVQHWINWVVDSQCMTKAFSQHWIVTGWQKQASIILFQEAQTLQVILRRGSKMGVAAPYPLICCERPGEARLLKILLSEILRINGWKAGKKATAICGLTTHHFLFAWRFFPTEYELEIVRTRRVSSSWMMHATPIIVNIFRKPSTMPTEKQLIALLAAVFWNFTSTLSAELR